MVTDREYVDDTTEYEPFAPSCEEIEKDNNLVYSDVLFKQKIPRNEPSHENIHIFPEPHVFVHFSLIAYDDDPRINSDLAPGWQVLTTATNTKNTKKQHVAIQATKAVFRWVRGMDKNATDPSTCNGYFGVTFWHPKNHQLVIAHRGTIDTCVGALETDFHGVIHNKYVPQMFSAATFAVEVVEAFRNKNVHFQLFFTGHSLGGWLAQITTFTIKYLHLAPTNSEGASPICFCRLPRDRIDSEESTSVHAHTIVFDSPGCKEMLRKLADGFDVRYSEKIVQVNELDITSYMSALNLFNTRNSHVGTLFRLYPDIEKNIKFESVGNSWMDTIEKLREVHEKINYTFAVHGIKRLFKVFVLEESAILKDTQNLKSTNNSTQGDHSKKKYKLVQNVQIHEVVDWPETNGISGGEEFDDFLKWAYEGYIKSPTLPGCCTIRYQVKTPDKDKRSVNVFTQHERDVLEQYQLVRTFLNATESELSEEHQNLLSDYKIDNLYIHSFEKINQLAAGVPFFLRKYENFAKQIKTKLTPAGVATFDYLKSINQNDYSFNCNLETVTTILESNGPIWEFTAQNSTAAFIRLVDSLKKKFFHHHRHFQYVALSYEKLMQLTNDQTFLPEEFNEGRHILVINCGNLNDGQKKRIEKLRVVYNNPITQMSN